MTAPVWWDITNPKKDITKKALIDALGELKTDQYVIGKKSGWKVATSTTKSVSTSRNHTR